MGEKSKDWALDLGDGELHHGDKKPRKFC